MSKTEDDRGKIMSKTALITGVTGMDGSHLSEFLLDKGYEVWGLIRRNSSSDGYSRIEHIADKINLRYGDLTDISSIHKIVKESMPDEIYNLAAMSHVGLSFKMPEYTFQVDGTGVLNILESMREIVPNAKMYQASTSEIFGISPAPQNEDTRFHPRSPYGVAKLAGYWSVVNYRESYDMFCCNGILFNHESERRGENFVTKKITKSVARIKLGKQSHIQLGNLDAQRDWGYAPDFIEAMWKMLQQDKPEDFVIATGVTWKVREFLQFAFDAVGIQVESNGKTGLEEEWVNVKTGKMVVCINPEFHRPAEVFHLCGDFRKANKVLGWNPKMDLKNLVKRMVDYDIEKESDI
jgi:GDPmannose 4,6-dehydratase